MRRGPHDHTPDRRDAAAMYQIGLPAYDPHRRTWPGADQRPPHDAERGGRLRRLLALARKLARPKP